LETIAVLHPVVHNMRLRPLENTALCAGAGWPSSEFPVAIHSVKADMTRFPSPKIDRTQTLSWKK
jgi:hypothetical protein